MEVVLKKIKNVMLIQPPVTRPMEFSAKNVRVSPFFPLGLAYLAAYLEKSGKYDIHILDALAEGDIDEGSLVEGGAKIRYGLTDEEIRALVVRLHAARKIVGEGGPR